MSRETSEYIAARIRCIQSRHNFHPTCGARQIAGIQDRAAIGAYAVFRAFCTMSEKLHLNVPIPYDPSGLDPLGHIHERSARQSYIYFARTLRSKEWKVGYSVDPHTRCRQLQTGNADHLEILYMTPGDRRLEALVHRQLEVYRIPYGGGREWFASLTEAAARGLIHRLRAEGTNLERLRPELEGG